MRLCRVKEAYRSDKAYELQACRNPRPDASDPDNQRGVMGDRAPRAPRYGAKVRGSIRAHYADAASSPGRPSADAPCAAVTPFVVRAPCEQIHQESTSPHVGRYFDAAPQRTRCGGAAGGSSSSVAER